MPSSLLPLLKNKKGKNEKVNATRIGDGWQRLKGLETAGESTGEHSARLEEYQQG